MSAGTSKISQKKLEANRRNAQKSTGPKTPAGKAISSMNGLTHGLTSQKCPILPGEDEQEFLAFAERMRRDLRPRGEMQTELVDDLIDIRWKLRRIPKVENHMMIREQRDRRSYYEHVGQYDSQAARERGPEDSTLDILARSFESSDNGFARLELHRLRLQRTQHTLLREWRMLREETGTDESEPTMASGSANGETEPTESANASPEKPYGNELGDRRMPAHRNLLPSCAFAPITGRPAGSESQRPPGSSKGVLIAASIAK